MIKFSQQVKQMRADNKPAKKGWKKQSYSIVTKIHKTEPKNEKARLHRWGF
jgi:hypothetical protein